MQTPLDYLLAYHCAPALAGIKSASLVSCDQTRYPNLPAQIERYNRVLNPRGLRFRILCACGGSRLLLVYREACLERALSAPRAQAMLQAAGYPVGMPAELLLDKTVNTPAVGRSTRMSTARLHCLTGTGAAAAPFAEGYPTGTPSSRCSARLRAVPTSNALLDGSPSQKMRKKLFILQRFCPARSRKCGFTWRLRGVTYHLQSKF